MSLSIWVALQEMGISVSASATPRQLACPFHAGGKEQHLSARIYPETNSLYCFTCHRAWTAEQLLREWYGEPLGPGLRNATAPSGTRLDARLADLITTLQAFPDYRKRLTYLRGAVDDIVVKAAQGGEVPPLLWEISSLQKQWWPALYAEDDYFTHLN